MAKQNNRKEPKPLMSKIMGDMKKYLTIGEQADVTLLRQFLLNDPQRPLISTGHGGSYASAMYAALLYGTNAGLGRAVTAYSCNSLSDETLKNAKLLIISKGMKNQDLTYIAKRAMRVNPKHTCTVMTTKNDPKNDVLAALKKKCPDRALNYDFQLPTGFIGTATVFGYFSLLYKAFTGDDDFVSKLALSTIPEENYTYRTIGGETPPPLEKIKHFSVIFGGYGEPVAHNIESDMVEAGLCACMVSDYRNQCHGRFMLTSNSIRSKHLAETEEALIVLVTPREETLCRQFLNRLPLHVPVVIIKTELTGPLAAIDLLYKANCFIADFGENHLGSNPNNPKNYGGIEKGVFRDMVNFEDDFKKFGRLDMKSQVAPIIEMGDLITQKSCSGAFSILGTEFRNVETPYLMAAFDDSRESVKSQQKIIDPTKPYMDLPERITQDFLKNRYSVKQIRTMDFEKGPRPWAQEWKKWLQAEQALQNGQPQQTDIDVELLNSAYINWLGQTLRFTRQPDGRVVVDGVTPGVPETLPEKGLIGGICGEVLGSKWELEKDKEKVKALVEKPLKFYADMSYTDDTILTLAIAKWLMTDKKHSKETLIDLLKHFATRYKPVTFGRNFKKWAASDDREPYGAPTNGSAMRVGAVAWYAKTLEECLALAKTTAEVTHNSDEGIRGAQSVAAAIFLNRTGKSKQDIKQYIEKTFGYDLNRTTAEIRPTYQFETACDKSVPESIICFLEGRDFEECIRLAISLGGDTDTMGCIAGNIAAASMPVPADMALKAYEKLPLELREIFDAFEAQ